MFRGFEKVTPLGFGMEWNDDEGLDSGLDPDGPSAEDLDRFGGEFVTCPSCGNEIYDQAPVCHVCGEVLQDESSGVPGWAALAAAAVIVGLLIVVF